MNRRHLAALIPLHIAILAIAIRNIDRPGRVPEIAGWLLVAGTLAALAGYALAWRRASRPGD